MMGFVAAIKSGLRGFVRFSGRATLAEFWWFVLFLVIGAVIARMLDAMLFPTPDQLVDDRLAMQSTARPVSMGWFMVTILPLAAASVRRMHDSGRTAWHLFVPLAVSIAAIALLFAGLVSTGLMDNWALDEVAWRGLALGAALLALLAVAMLQVVILVMVLWYLTTPGEPRDNRFGPLTMREAS